MEQKEIDELKRKFSLKKQAKEIQVYVPTDREKALETIINTLDEKHKNGENVYVKNYANVPKGFVSYKIYSCDLEGTTKEQFLSKIRTINSEIESAGKVIRRNGSYGLPEQMLESFNKREDVVYVYNGNNGVDAVFDIYDADARTDEDFLQYANILTKGETREEERKKEEITAEKIRIERQQREEEIRKQMPQWIEQGNSMIYLEKQEEWKNYVESFQGDNILYAGIVEQALEVMKSLEENGSLIEAEQILNNQNHTASSLAEVIDVVFKFSKKGPDFYKDATEHVLHQEIDEEKRRKIINQYADNNGYKHAEEIRRTKGERLAGEENTITTEKIGKATLNAPVELRQAVEQVETAERTEENIKEGEETRDDS